MKNLEVTLETAERWYKGDNQELKDIALSLYPELEKKELPKTWEEFVEIKGYYVDEFSKIHSLTGLTNLDNRSTFKTKEQAKASIALAQLSQLREIYRNGWVPDWSDNKNKYGIEFYENILNKYIYVNTNTFLSFQDAETRDLFLENFKDLIEKARPLFS